MEQSAQQISLTPAAPTGRPECVLFVHAHPDDETIATGGTIATLVDRGAAVCVVTCTRGELGEVIPADIRPLEGSDRLAAYRAGELDQAMRILGAADHRFLGDPGARLAGRPPRRYTDSGMRWGESGAEPRPVVAEDSLCAAELGEVAADIAAVIDLVRPTAVVSYDGTGGYGHPDHVRAHQAARRAADVMGVPFFAIQPDSVPQPAASSFPIVIDVSPVLDRKRAALRAYRSQLTVAGDDFALSSGPARPIGTIERFDRMPQSAPEPATWQSQGLGIHLFAYLLAVVVGAVLGGIVAVEHQFVVPISGVRLPVGIIVSLAIVAALLAGCRLVFGGRLVALFAAIGLLGAIGALSLASQGGSVLVPANPAGYLLSYGPAVIALVALAWPGPGTFGRAKLEGTVEPKGTASS